MQITNLDKSASKVLRRVIKSIAQEHFHITLHCDRNMNYLWYMYYKGNKKDVFRPFILAFELNLLVSLGLVSDEEKESLAKMITSQDVDNFYIGLLAIDNFRKQRIKLHGDWTKVNSNTQLPMVSKEFVEVANNYPVTVIKNYSLDRI